MRYQFKGTKWIIFWFVLLGFIAFIAYDGVKQSYADRVLEYENEQKYFNLNEEYSFNDEIVVEIEKIIPLEIELHNSRFYLIEFNGKNLFLKADQNDEHLKEVIDGKRTSLIVRYIEEIERQSKGRRYYHLNDELKNDLYNEALKNQAFIDKNEINFYLSLDYKNSQLVLFLFFIALIAIEMILIYVFIYCILSNRKALNYLFSLGQEKIADFSELINQSKYHNKILKLFIYQNELISYNKTIKTIPLNQIKSAIFEVRVSFGQRGRKHITYFLTFTLSNKTVSLPISKRKKVLEEGNVFLEDLKRMYPNIKIDNL